MTSLSPLWSRLRARQGPKHCAGVVVLSVAALLAGCGYQGASSLPLPGAIGGKGTYPVTIVLSDATNLVPKETCRANDAVVGGIESVTLDSKLRARVVCRIKDSVKLPANSIARLSETSLLGERFIALDPPAGVKPQGVLARGATLSMAATRTDPDVEVVFGALSQVLNGGGLGALETITRELNAALKNSDLGGTIETLNTVVSSFNSHRDQIADSLVALDRLAAVLARQRAVLAEALDEIPGGLAVLTRQRARLVSTLQRLSSLSQTAVPLIRATRANTTADLKHLAPVLAQVNKANDELALTLTRVSTFPFPSTALSTIKGDFAGMFGTYELDVDMLNRLLGQNLPAPAAVPKPTAGQPTPTSAPDAGSLLGSILGPSAAGLAELLNSVLGGGS